MTDPTGTKLLHHWFLDGLARNPSGPALAINDRCWTYAQLHELASRYADLLGAQSARRVGILASKSPEAYAGVLGALYAGASYVPLGPEVPVERNIAIAAAASIDALVVDAAGAGQLGPLGSAIAPRVIVAPDLDPEIVGRRPADVGNRAGPGEAGMAYTLFTSGSTGQPKGVPISHANVSAFLASSLDRYDVGPTDRFSQIYELTFDLAAFDMFMAWAVGACVCVMSRLHALNPARSAQRYGLTVWHTTPSLVSALRNRDALTAGSLPTLRYSVFCGERLEVSTARYWLRAACDSILDNIYGPTELTIACTAYRFDPDGPDVDDTVPIGTANAGMESRLIGPDGIECDDAGELCMSGDQMFVGYLDPANDIGRFVTIDGRRWYRTGDRVRVDPRVGLIHVGRVDDQVKVRGYRVELAEVEHAIRADTAADAVAVVVEQPEQMLVAFVISDSELDSPALTERLCARLPGYMVPQYVWQLDEIPLNRHGKVDRAALRAEATRRLDLSTSHL